eukprot:UN21539
MEVLQFFFQIFLNLHLASLFTRSSSHYHKTTEILRIIVKVYYKVFEIS